MANSSSFPIGVALLVVALIEGCGGSRGVVAGQQTFHGRPQAEETRSRIAFVRCMRAHGVAKFPYPTANGHVSVAMVRARGINPQAPALARVVSECLPPWLRPPGAR